MSQQGGLCSICKQRPANRRMKMKLSRKLTGYYVVARTYRTTYAEFPVCEEDFQKIMGLSKRRSLAFAGFFFGTVFALGACIAGYPGLANGSIVLIFLLLVAAGLEIAAAVSGVVGLSANGAFNHYKSIVEASLAQQEAARAAAQKQ